ncbi:MAG: histidinol-phosphatase [Desulfobacteraceae bacterium]
MTTTARVSIHGGHSGQFCSHARGTLEEVILAYVAQGFVWVGITEHMPPTQDRFMYIEEQAAGLTIDALMERFDRYMAEGRRLQKKYADQLEIFIGFETEAYTGAMAQSRQLIDRYQPDYVLAGVHHVADIPFDSGPADYQRAVKACGDVEALYCRYFDLQLEVMQTLQPKVIAHFDLIRIFDQGYARRWQVPAIRDRVERNLDHAARNSMILDYNVAALRKGMAEPYIAMPILEMARQMGIPVVPGDDSHGPEMVGAHIDDGIVILEREGFSTHWPSPLTGGRFHLS